jgi:hypothetical protein
MLRDIHDDVIEGRDTQENLDQMGRVCETEWNTFSQTKGFSDLIVFIRRGAKADDTFKQIILNKR